MGLITVSKTEERVVEVGDGGDGMLMISEKHAHRSASGRIRWESFTVVLSKEEIQTAVKAANEVVK